MTTQAFNQGIAVLNKVFPKVGIEARFFWDVLNDLDGGFFLMATKEIVKTIPELYPGTNMIAIIRRKVEELQVKAQKNFTLKLETETEKERIERWQKEAVPMPAECAESLAKLGIKTGGEND